MTAVGAGAGVATGSGAAVGGVMARCVGVDRGIVGRGEGARVGHLPADEQAEEHQHHGHGAEQPEAPVAVGRSDRRSTERQDMTAGHRLGRVPPAPLRAVGVQAPDMSSGNRRGCRLRVLKLRHIRHRGRRALQWRREAGHLAQRAGQVERRRRLRRLAGWVSCGRVGIQRSVLSDRFLRQRLRCDAPQEAAGPFRLDHGRRRSRLDDRGGFGNDRPALAPVLGASALVPLRGAHAADDLDPGIKLRTRSTSKREANGDRVAEPLERARSGRQTRRRRHRCRSRQVRRLRLGRAAGRFGAFECGIDRPERDRLRFGVGVFDGLRVVRVHRFWERERGHRRWQWRRGCDLVDGLVPEEEFRRLGDRDGRRALTDQLARLRLVESPARRPRQRGAAFRAEPGRSFDGRRPVMAHRSFRQVVLLRDQTDLAEQLVHRIVGHVDAGEIPDA